MAARQYLVFEFRGAPDKATRELLKKEFNMSFIKLSDPERRRPGVGKIDDRILLTMKRTSDERIWRLDAFASDEWVIEDKVVERARQRLINALEQVSDQWVELPPRDYLSASPVKTQAPRIDCRGGLCPAENNRLAGRVLFSARSDSTTF